MVGDAARKRHLRAAGDGGRRLLVQLLLRLVVDQRAEVRLRLLRVTDLELLHFLHERLEEAVVHGLHNNEALRPDARLARVQHAAHGRAVRGTLDVGVRQHQRRVAAAQLQHAGLQQLGGGGADGHACGGGAGEGDGADGAVAHDALDVVGEHGQVHVDVERHSRGVGGLVEHVLDEDGALGHVRRVLAHDHVARREGSGRLAEHLPEREVPRHDEKHGAQRLLRDVRRRGARQVDVLVLQECVHLVRVVVGDGGALQHLALALRDRLAHLHGDDLRVLLRVLAEDLAGLAEQGLTLLQREAGPLGLHVVCALQTGDALLRRPPLHLPRKLTRVRVDGLQADATPLHCGDRRPRHHDALHIRRMRAAAMKYRYCSF
eukprot:Rhum_TRINITY_DN15727_c0_g1::Rhum_TRINITY_DN15727_c0_g1_i1::g.161961::m.161961